MVIIRHFYIGSRAYIYLIWNLFLSWIPFGVSMMMTYLFSHNSKKHSLILIFLGCFWLLFYPNAPYMITDFIHYRFSSSFLAWIDLVIFSAFILTSFLIGFISLFLVSRIVEKKFNKPFAWLFILCTLFLSSYGIYLGRVIRWNSWDLIFKPAVLVRSLIENIHTQSIIFSLTYGALLTLIYGFLYGLTYLRLEKID